MAEKKRRKRRYPKAHLQYLNEHRHRYEELLEKQGGTCALCSRRPTTKRRLDMDHHHKEMRLRGLLCVPCNRAVRDWMTVEWALKLAEYLDPKRKV